MRTIRFLLCVIILSASLIPTATPLLADSNSEMLQCMSDCIIQEGEDEKATCKQRCAKIMIDMNQGQNKDCMAVYKQCKKDCDSKACKKDCKNDLMNCV
jgi:hypothetical protein